MLSEFGTGHLDRAGAGRRGKENGKGTFKTWLEGEKAGPRAAKAPSF